MGVLNVTPDSFSDGGDFVDPDVAVKRALEMVAEGASIIDIGGESSRPGSEPVSQELELVRVIPVIKKLSTQTDALLSIDTTKPVVAQAAMASGASIINDIGGLRNPDMVAVAAETGATVCIMHMQGEPKSMQAAPQYDDVVTEVMAFLADRIEAAEHAGIQNIWIDPGIGFGKTLEHNMTLLRELKQFKKLGKPLLLGTSRKSFIEKIMGAPVEERLPGTLASNIWGMSHGADILRVHDVAEHKQAIDVLEAIQ